jgi:hypothetical protein
MRMSDKAARRRDESEAPPPLFGRWRNLYVLLLVELGVLVLLFYALTWWAS